MKMTPICVLGLTHESRLYNYNYLARNHFLRGFVMKFMSHFNKKNLRIKLNMRYVLFGTFNAYFGSKKLLRQF